MLSRDRIRDHVDDIARRLANIDLEFRTLTASFDQTEQGAGFAHLRRQIERARQHAEGLAAAMREP